MSVRVNELLRLGETQGRIRRMPTPFWGIRDVRLPADLEARCRAFLPRLGSAFFSHVTAALLWKLPLPNRSASTDRLHVAFASGHRAPRANGITGHELTVRPGEVVHHRGIPLTSPSRTWRDLASTLDLPHLVALGDAILRRWPAVAARELSTQSSIPGIRGRRALLDASSLLDSRAESPQESMLRIALVRANLPGLDVNPTLRDPDGRFVARVDLAFHDYPVVVEFDGDIHRSDAVTWRRDVGRQSAIQDLGFDLVRVVGDDSPRFADAIARVERRLAWHGWTPSRTHRSQ